ncbi:MAG: heme exporter protein CcmD [Xanthomonadales bacterium]|nr:heme exporter protein CcmD [Xanthomonadales bacterium]
MSEFLAMGGYGAYVWSAYAVTAVVLAWDATAPFRRRRALRRQRPRRPVAPTNPSSQP